MADEKTQWRLITVNTAPERAKRLIGRMIAALKDQYNIDHLHNCENMDEVLPNVTKYRPNVIFCASMWTPEQADTIFATARSVVPDIKTIAIPTGLQVERGPDVVVEFLLEHVPKLLG
ncbi:hypothetical protein SEUCBS139899_003303 [Sporothrix eucalyptigena]